MLTKARFPRPPNSPVLINEQPDPHEHERPEGPDDSIKACCSADTGCEHTLTPAHGVAHCIGAVVEGGPEEGGGRASFQERRSLDGP